MFRNAMRALAVVLALSLAALARIPAGTPLTIRLTSEITSRTARSGQGFHGTLARSVVIRGKTVARAGAPVSGVVAHAKPSGRLHAPGELSVRLTSIRLNGELVALRTSLVSTKGKSHKKGNIEKIGGGAAAGTLIGALAGGGKGALIGAAAGGAAGTGVAAATGKEEAVFHAEQALTFRVRTATVESRSTRR
ncbi:MAG TPA: hypothetical protein VGR48_06920 [Terriglobales bacterium]|nr:hypothetical protein [Terriglobales bacterium]